MALDPLFLFTSARDYWRANVGRLSHGHLPRFRNVVEQVPSSRAIWAIAVVRDSGLRRTADRWRLFLALFGEEP